MYHLGKASKPGGFYDDVEGPKKKKKKKEDTDLKRPVSSYFAFSKVMREHLLRHDPNLAKASTDVSKKCSYLWKELTDEEKKVWQTQYSRNIDIFNRNREREKLKKKGQPVEEYEPYISQDIDVTRLLPLIDQMELIDLHQYQKEKKEQLQMKKEKQQMHSMDG